MQCSVEQCEKPVRYKAACLCQKHYFRQWRYGTTETKLQTKKRDLGFTRQPRVSMPVRGYQRLYLPDHPLADTQGYVAEHRKVVFDRIGHSLHSCELCGKPETWATVHIDHIDNNPRNNDPANLRPLCRPCNTFRDYPERHTMKGNHAIELDGVTLTANEWSRAGGGYLSHNAIVCRIKSGMTAEQALLTPKTTHKGGIPYTRKDLIEQARRLKKDKSQ